MALSPLTLASNNLSGTGTVAVSGLTAGATVVLTSNPEGAFYFDGASLLYTISAGTPRTLHPVLTQTLGDDAQTTVFAVNVAGSYAAGPPLIPNLTSSLIDFVGGDPTSRAGILYRGNVRNPNPAATKRWRSACAAARAGVANARLLAVGDSTTRGVRAGGGSAQVATSWPKFAADILATQTGLPVGIDSFYGTGSGNAASTMPALDARFTTSGTFLASLSSAGGRTIQASATASLTFTPIKNVDTFEITYVQNAGFGTFSYAVNGGSTTNVITAGTKSVQKVTVSATLGANALTMSWVSGTIYIVGVEAYNSAIKQISVINAGWASSEAMQWSVSGGNVFEPLSIIPASIMPDLIVLDLGLNDMNNVAYTIAQYSTAINRILDTWLPGSDVVLKSFVPTSANWAALSRQGEFLQALYDISDARKLPLIDVYRARGAYTDNISYYDGASPAVHQSIKGYANVGEYVTSYSEV